MSIAFPCEKCGRRYEVAEKMIGKKATCECGNVVQVPEADSTDRTVKPTSGQVERYERINSGLTKHRGLPIYGGPLYDPAKVTLRHPDEVARRVLILWAVSLRGEGVPLREIWEMIDRRVAWFEASPIEQRFLKNHNPKPDESQQAVWRLEAMLPLLWALGHFPKLTWPNAMCDVEQLVDLVAPEAHNREFITQATLRDKEKILDALELTMRIHWALVNAHVNKKQVPKNLDWLRPDQMVPAAPLEGGAVIDQRHLTLNWIVRFGDFDWDDVDTHT